MQVSQEVHASCGFLLRFERGDEFVLGPSVVKHIRRGSPR
jgi:hypothetical protein